MRTHPTLALCALMPFGIVLLGCHDEFQREPRNVTSFDPELSVDQYADACAVELIGRSQEPIQG